MFCLGITRITSVDFDYAKQMQSTIKLLGIAKKQTTTSQTSQAGHLDEEVSIFVSPVVVPLSNVIGTVHGASNIVNIASANCMQGAYVGQGAGRFPTANSVINDIVRLAQGLIPSRAFGASASVASIRIQHDFEGKFYVRIRICDGLGIIRSVGASAEDAGISINSILQLPIQNHQSVDFVVTTDNARLSQVQQFVKAIESLPFVLETPLFMPMLE